MKKHRYVLHLTIESNDDQEDWIRENVEDLIANPEDDFLSLVKYSLTCRDLVKKDGKIKSFPKGSINFTQSQIQSILS